jgi:hypothetical protein
MKYSLKILLTCAKKVGDAVSANNTGSEYGFLGRNETCHDDCVAEQLTRKSP